MEIQEHFSSEPREFAISDETGRALPWPVVLCLFVSLGYLVFLRNYVEHAAPEFYGTIIIVCLAIANIFALGCSLQLLFMGTESNGYIRRNLKRQCNELAEIVTSAKEYLTVYEEDLGRTRVSLTAKGIDSLALLRRITTSLDARISEINRLIRSGSKVDLIDADELFKKKLMLDENPVTSVIGGSSGGIPPIPPDEWAASISSLIGTVRVEQRRTA